MGFCVASTRKGSGSGYVWLADGHLRSCIASSRALCTLAGARLISSASTMLAKIGPLRVWNSPSLRVVDQGADDVGGQQVGRELDSPEGSCTARRQGADGERLGQAGHALDEHVAVDNRAISRRSMRYPWPTMTFAISRRRFSTASSSDWGIVFSGEVAVMGSFPFLIDSLIGYFVPIYAKTIPRAGR